MGMEAQLIFDIRITIILIVVYLTRSKTNYKKRMVFLLGYVFYNNKDNHSHGACQNH